VVRNVRKIRGVFLVIVEYKYVVVLYSIYIYIYIYIISGYVGNAKWMHSNAALKQ